MTQRPEGPGLIRVLGRWDLTAVGVNQVIGSGIFVLPASVAALVGSSSSLGPFVLAGAANILIVLCFAAAATRFTHAGGPYLYASAAFGPLAGFQLAWMLWLTRVSSQAALANAIARYASFFWEDAEVGWRRILLVSATVVVLAVINFLGVRYGSLAINVFTVSKLLPLALFVGVGVWFVDAGAFSGATLKLDAATGEAVLLLMFAFGGYELVTLPAGEARTPQRDIPRALVSTILVVTVVFLAVQTVAVGTLPGVAESATPIADAAARFLGPWAAALLAVGALIAIAGSNAGSMLAGPRITYAMGERRQLPAFMAHVHPRFHTPDVSIAVFATVALGLALSGSFEQMAKVSALARLLVYVGTCAAVMVLRRRPAETESAFRLPGGDLIPLLALGAALAIIAGADVASLVAGAVALACGVLLYAVYGRHADQGVGW